MIVHQTERVEWRIQDPTWAIWRPLHLEVDVADILIPDVPDEIVAAIDRHARQEGLSRDAYLRLLLARERPDPTRAVRVADIRRMASAAADLGDDSVMRDAWR